MVCRVRVCVVRVMCCVMGGVVADCLLYVVWVPRVSIGAVCVCCVLCRWCLAVCWCVACVWRVGLCV